MASTSTADCPRLKAIVLPAPETPPIVLFAEPPSIYTPVPLPSGFAPVTSVPIKIALDQPRPCFRDQPDAGTVVARR